MQSVVRKPSENALQEYTSKHGKHDRKSPPKWGSKNLVFYAFWGSEPQGAPWESQGPTQGANSRPKNTKMTQTVLQNEVPQTEFFMFEGSGPQGAPWGSQGATQDANSQPKKYQNGVPKPTQISENRSKTNPIVSFVCLLCLSSLCLFTLPNFSFFKWAWGFKKGIPLMLVLSQTRGENLRWDPGTSRDILGYFSLHL